METLTTVLRAGLSLVCVLGLVWVLARMARKHPLNRRSGTDRTEVLARQQLSRAASLAVVRVGERTLVLGVTEQQVTLLHEGPLGDELDLVEDPTPHETHGTEDDVTTTVLPLPAATPPSTPDTVTPIAGRRAARVSTTKAPAADRRGALTGSALSPATWATAVDVLRERTVRR